MTSPPSKWAIFGLVSVGTFMTTLDTSIVNIALPSIAQSFGTPVSGPIEWVVIGYLVVIAATLLSLSRLADIVGRERVWIAAWLSSRPGPPCRARLPRSSCSSAPAGSRGSARR